MLTSNTSDTYIQSKKDQNMSSKRYHRDHKCNLEQIYKYLMGRLKDKKKEWLLIDGTCDSLK